MMTAQSPFVQPSPTLMLQPAIDCHVHVFDPQRFAYAPDAWYLPSPAETGTPALLRQVLDAHEVQHALIVGPNSGYGLDNRCLLDTLAQGQGRYKGIAVVANHASLDELQELKAAGVVGVAFNPALLGTDFYANTAPLLQHLRDLDMWAQVQVEGDQLLALNPLLLDSGAKILFDHCGRPNAASGLGQGGFASLLSWADTSRACVKLSGCAKFAVQPYPYADARPYVDALIEAFTPQALVWASDWPFLRAPARMDYGPLRALVRDWLPDKEDQSAVLWDTPRLLFGFGNGVPQCLPTRPMIASPSKATPAADAVKA